jgi:hypothetical protein
LALEAGEEERLAKAPSLAKVVAVARSTTFGFQGRSLKNLNVKASTTLSSVSVGGETERLTVAAKMAAT